MQPQIHINFLAIPVAALASFVLGAIWYGPIFGKTWSAAMGFSDKPGGAEIAKGSVLNLIGVLLMSFVLSHDVAVWRPSTWGVGADQPPYIYGFFAGLFTWLGYIVPMLLNGVGFERKSWKVFAITAPFQFLSLQAMGMILSYWRR